MSFLSDLIQQSPARESLARVVALALAEGVTDLLANSASEWWIDTGGGLERVPELVFDDQTYVECLRLLIALTGRHVDLVSPVTDGAITATELPLLEEFGVSRLRVHVALAAGIAASHLLSIRVHRREVLGLDDLQAQGVLTQRQLAALRWIIEERKNFLVVGAAGAGKTTLLRAMLAESSALRTIVVEDTAELMPLPVHAVGLQARPANSDGAGAIGIERLLQETLRMRPDRIVVGEVRGREALVLLQAMNTGHAGSAATIHANSGDAVLARLRAVIPSGDISDSGLKVLAAGSLDYVIRIERTPTGRAVTQIQEFEC